MSGLGGIGGLAPPAAQHRRQHGQGKAPPGWERRQHGTGLPGGGSLSPCSGGRQLGTYQCPWSMCCRMSVCGATVPYLSTSGMFMSSMK